MNELMLECEIANGLLSQLCHCLRPALHRASISSDIHQLFYPHVQNPDLQIVLMRP